MSNRKRRSMSPQLSERIGRASRFKPLMVVQLSELGISSGLTPDVIGSSSATIQSVKSDGMLLLTVHGQDGPIESNPEFWVPSSKEALPPEPDPCGAIAAMEAVQQAAADTFGAHFYGSVLHKKVENAITLIRKTNYRTRAK